MNINMSFMDAAIVINLIRQEGKHPDHIRIANDLENQMLSSDDPETFKEK